MTSVPQADEQSVAMVPTSASLPVETAPIQKLEDRVHRLEEAVAALTEMQHWDESPRQLEPASRTMPQVSSDVPRAMPIPPPPTASLAEFSLPSTALPPVAPPSKLTTLLQPVKSALPVASSMMNKVLPASSLWRDFWWDIRIAWRMFRDPYYPMSTAFKVVPLFAIFYVTIWPWFSAWTGIFGTVMNYCVNAVVIYIAFKVIQRELRRYYDFAEKYRR